MSKKKKTFYGVERGDVKDHPTKEGQVVAGSLEAASNYVEEEAKKPIILDEKDLGAINYDDDNENKFKILTMYKLLKDKGFKLSDLEEFILFSHSNGKGLAWVQSTLADRGIFKLIETLEQTERTMMQKMMWELSKSKNQHGTVKLER